MVGLEEERGSSYNYSCWSRIESGRDCKVGSFRCRSDSSDDLYREMRKFQTKDATVAKLFAKHIKIQDSIKFLKSTRTGIAVGTPTRLKDLMDDGRHSFLVLCSQIS